MIINSGCRMTFKVHVLIVTRKLCDMLVNQNSAVWVVQIHLEKYLYPLLLFIHHLQMLTWNVKDFIASIKIASAGLFEIYF